MEFVHAARVEGLPKIISIQNSYSLLVRRFEGKAHPEIKEVKIKKEHKITPSLYISLYRHFKT